MSPSISADSISEGVEKNRESHHDTIYVTESQANKLKQNIQLPLTSSSIDSLRIHGLSVETMPRLALPIVCKKGEVFPLAKDWKNGDCQHE